MFERATKRDKVHELSQEGFSADLRDGQIELDVAASSETLGEEPSAVIKQAKGIASPYPLVVRESPVRSS